jgi:S-adenosylmethionine hydrolase
VTGTSEASGVVTLITDFGTIDHFAGVMKGVILRIAPKATVVDITHEISPFSLHEAGFVVSQSYPYFPAGTVHVVVVDPGVGSSRRAIAVEAAGQFFVGPDNGVFSMLYMREQCRVFGITNRELMGHELSQTFHGRDVFAPVGAHLITGVPVSQVGDEIDDYHRVTVGIVPERTGKRIWTGAILKIDRFGNIITNFLATELPDLTLQSFEMQIGFQKIDTITRSYADAKGDFFAILGSSGYIEISANQQSAAKLLGVTVGAPVELTLY